MAKVIADWRRATLDAQEYAILEFAEKLTDTPGLVGRDDVERLAAVGLTDRDIFAAIQATGYRNFISRLLDSIGLDLRGKDHSAGITAAFDSRTRRRRTGRSRDASPIEWRTDAGSSGSSR